MPSPREIDRVAPTLRPAGRAVMYQRWAELLFLHWVVPESALMPLVPEGLELDTFEGRAYVGLVAFTMTGVRHRWTPALPFISSFHEVNVRTYVHLGGQDPGVLFLSLDAACLPAVCFARAFWSLPYHLARMELILEAEGGVRYASERRWPGPRPAGCSLRYERAGVAGPAEAGSLAAFLTERYILYARCSGRLYNGRVHHAPYPLQAAVIHGFRESLLGAAGLSRPDEAPLAHYASEVRVELFPLRRVRG